MQPSTHSLFEERPARWNRTSRVALVLSLGLHLVAAVAVKTFRGGPAMGFEPADSVMTVEFSAESVGGVVVPSEDSISRVGPVSTPPPQPAVADSAEPLSPDVSEGPPEPAMVPQPKPVSPPRPEQRPNAVAAGRSVENVVAPPTSGISSAAATGPTVAQERAGDPRVASGAVSNVVSASGPPGVLARPVYRRNPEPPYPLAARRRRQEGVVLLAVDVTAKGRAARVAVQKSSGYKLLDEAAARAVQDWEFEPAREGAVAVDSRIEVPVRFRLAE